MHLKTLCGVLLPCCVASFPAHAETISSITGGTPSLTVGLTQDSTAPDQYRPSESKDSFWVNQYSSVNIDTGETLNAYKVLLGPNVTSTTTTQPKYPSSSLTINGTLNVYGSGLDVTKASIVDNGNQNASDSSSITIAPGGTLRAIGGDLTIGATTLQMSNYRPGDFYSKSYYSSFLDTNGHNILLLADVSGPINKIGEGTLFLSAPSSTDSNGTQHFLSAQSHAYSSLGEINNFVQGTVVATSKNISNLDYISLSYRADVLPEQLQASTDPALLTKKGTLVLDQDDDGVVKASLNGAGYLVKRGTGNVTIDYPENDYDGGTTIEGGTLTGIPEAFGPAPITLSSNGTLALSTEGAVTDGVINDDNIDSLSEDRDETEFANTISGSGSITKEGSGSVYLTGNGEQFTGNITVQNGNLGVNSSSFGNASVTVESGGMFSGTGTIGNLTVAGTLAPGRSGANPAVGLAGGAPIGTLNVHGNVTMQAGSTFDVLAQNRQADLLNASGTVNLSGAALHFTVLDSLPMRSQDRYTLVNAEGGLLSQFSNTSTFLQSAKNLQGEQPYLVPTLNYTDKQAQIIVKDIRSTNSDAAGTVTQNQTTNNDTTSTSDNHPTNPTTTPYRPNFRLALATRNENAAADGLSTLVVATNGGGTLGNALVNLTRSQAHQALGALSGEGYASARTALVNESYYLRNTLINRLDCVTSSIGCPSNTTGNLKGTESHPLNLWGVTYGSVGGNAGSNGTSSLNQSSVGWIMGADTTLHQWRVGAMLAYGRSMFSEAGTHNSSSHANTASLGLYGGRAWTVGGLTRDGALTLKLGTSYSWNVIHTNRSIRFTGYNERTSSNYLAGTAQAFEETGYRFTLNAHHAPLTIEPFIRMTYLNTQYGSFHENGQIAALKIRGQVRQLGYGTFGLKGATHFTFQGLTLAPHLNAAYRYGFGATHTSARASFAAAGNQATMMDVAGTPISANTALLNTGFSAHLAQRLDMSADYMGQYGSHITSSGGFGSMTYRF